MRLTAAALLALMPAAAMAQPHKIAPGDVFPTLGLPGETALTPWLGRVRQADKNVFIGGVNVGYALLAKLIATDPMLLSGRIGLYQHANGNSTLTSAQLTNLWSTWQPTGTTLTGQGQNVGEIGGYTLGTTGTYVNFFGGRYPNEVNMNILSNDGDGTGTYTATTGDAAPGTVYTGYVSAADLATIQSAVQEANALGAENVSIFFTPNGGGEDLADPFATAPYWANVRAAILLSGGVALDAPPSYYFARGAPYQSIVQQMIVWTEAQGKRVSQVVSPYNLSGAGPTAGGCGYDGALVENTRGLLQQEIHLGIAPTQWVVENYGPPSAGCAGTENDWSMNDATPESLNQVALLLAYDSVTAPTGTSPAGSNGVAEAGLESPAAPVAAAMTSSSGAHVGPLHLADILGWGDMALEHSDNVSIGGGVLTNVEINTTVQAQLLGGAIIGGFAVVQSAAGPVAMDANTAGTLTVALPGGGAAILRVLGGTVTATNILGTNVGSTGSPIGVGYFDNLNAFGATRFFNGLITLPITSSPGMAALATTDPHKAGQMWMDPANNNALHASGG